MTHRAADVAVGRTVAQHRQHILSTLSPLPPVELPIAESLHRTLAEDLIARVDVPGFDNSAMDGYALRHVDAASATPDAPVALVVVADLPAGSPENPEIGAGETARIMTGAPLPTDADCVVPLEDTDEGTMTVGIRRAPARAAHIRRAGSDVHVGDRVLTSGRRLHAQDLAAAASAGVDSLFVYPAPRVGVLSTGSELRPAGEALGRGQIHDSNSVLIAAAVAECGGIAVQLGSIPDDEDALRSLLERVTRAVDVVVTTGGVSVGAYDIVNAVLAPYGVWFGAVRMQPGKPQGFGAWIGVDGPPGVPIFALPGNPVGAFISFEQFVRPALLALQGRSVVSREVLQGVVSEGWSSPRDRVQFMPASVQWRPDRTLSVRPASGGGSGSFLVASLAKANALAIVAESVTEVAVGDLVDVTVIR
ncbi:molybdopterin molybdotransferase MoeA [soil metagenome]